MTRPILRRDRSYLTGRTELIERRLANVGVRVIDIPRFRGVGPRGYRTVVTDRKGVPTVDIRSPYHLATRSHRWRIPASTVLGIFAAVRSLDRYEYGKSTTIHPNRPTER